MLLNDILVVLATISGTIATLPQLANAFKNLLFFKSLSLATAVLVTISTLSWLAVDMRLGYPAFVFSGVVAVILDSTLVGRWIWCWYKTRKSLSNRKEE